MLQNIFTANARQIQRNYKALFDEVKSKKKPLFIMKGTDLEVVILDPETYQDLIDNKDEKSRLRRKVGGKNVPWRT